MPPCTELHIPYKKYGFSADLPSPHHLEQNFLAIERWARQQSCGGGGSAPQSWCGSDVLTVSIDGYDTTSNVDTSDATADYLICTVHARIEENSSGGVLKLVGYWVVGGSTLNSHTAIEDWGWTWPQQAVKTLSSTCVVEAGSTVAFTMLNAGSATTDALVRVGITVVEALDHQTDACCSVGA